MKSGIWIIIKNSPIFDKKALITLSFKLFQVKYSNNCIEIKDKKYNDFTKLITFVKYANKTPTKLNKNVFSDTSAFQHIYI